MKYIAGIYISLVMMVSCTNDALDLTTGLADETFRAWISQNAPSATLLENDVYIKFWERGTTNPTLTPTNDSLWIQLRYTARKLDGTVIVTRSEEMSKMLGKWLATTHFNDDYTSLSPYSTTLNFALRRGIQEMHEGDSARIYIPAKVAYSTGTTAFNAGYLGDAASYTAIPLYIDVRLVEIVKKPIDRELAQVLDFAVQRWGLVAGDSLANGVYMRKTLSLPAADTIPYSDYSKVDVSQYFTDGFLVTTTLDSIAKVHGTYSSSVSYKPRDISITTSTEVPDQLVAKALKKMRYGEQAEIICISQWTTNGTAGLHTNKPQILPYSPRVYSISVHVPEVETTKK